MSKYRLKIFDECRNRTNPNIPNALGGVKYHTTMTDKQLSALASYLNANSINFKTLLTYDGMDSIASDVLCRWLRPSELTNLSLIMNQGDLTIQRATLKVQFPSDMKPGDFVGMLGDNLISLTRMHNLLYAWYHNSNKTLIMYSLRKGDLKSAMKDPLVKDYKVESKLEEKIGKANWGNVGQITNMRSYANVVRGTPATRVAPRKTVLGRPVARRTKTTAATAAATATTRRTAPRDPKFDKAMKKYGTGSWADIVQQQELRSKKRRAMTKTRA